MTFALLKLLVAIHTTPIDWTVYRDDDFDGPWFEGRPAWYPEYRGTLYIGVCDADNATLCRPSTMMCRAASRPCVKVVVSYGAETGPTWFLYTPGYP